MSNDSTYVVKTERFARSDTVYYRINKKDLRILYEQAFGEMVRPEVAQDHLVLGFTYIPLTLIFLIVITGVNLRWNRGYRRLKLAQESLDGMSAETKQYIAKLDLRHYQIWDRIKYYLTIWVMAGLFDTMMMLNDLLNIPLAALAACTYSIYKVIVRLVGGSALTGVNDQDLINGFNSYVKKMVINVVVENMTKIINKLKA